MVTLISRTMFPGSGRHGEDHRAKARRTKCCWKCPLKGNYHYLIIHHIIHIYHICHIYPSINTIIINTLIVIGNHRCAFKDYHLDHLWFHIQSETFAFKHYKGIFLCFMQICFWERTVVKHAKWSDPGGEEAQGSPVQLELRPTAQWASCAHLSGEKCVPCALCIYGSWSSQKQMLH